MRKLQQEMDLTQILFSLMFILLMIVACFWVVQPFILGFAWASMVVIATWPLMLKLQALLWGRRTLAIIAMTLILLLLFIIPVALLVNSLIDNVGPLVAWATSGNLHPPQLNWLHQIPLVGSKLYTSYHLLLDGGGSALMAKVQPYVGRTTGFFVAQAGHFGRFLLHLGLMLLFSILLFWRGEQVGNGIRHFAFRLASRRGDAAVLLASQAIRAVALGVVVTALVQGVLGGNGSIGALRVARGGTVAPGNSIGTLNVDGDVTFDEGSRYAVEVAPDGRSDRIASSRAITINGGEVAVSLENSANLLSQSEVQSLAGRQYNILTATQGVSGAFTSALPSYAFLGTTLGYQANQVSLTVGRNDATFASVAASDNERAVAAAAEALGAGNPVYESLLLSGSAGEARQAFRQLSGQVHADIASAQVNDSRYLRDTLNDRLRQAEGLGGVNDIKADEGGAWAKLLGAWDHASGDDSATGYQASTWGVLLGLDSAWADDWRMGVATGYTRTSLDGGYGSDADSDNYHLGVYGGKEYGSLALRAGAGYTWHRFDTSRAVRYGSQSDRASAQYSARTEQFFAEAGYRIPAGPVSLEPFANLSYVNFHNNRIAEQCGAAALHGDKQHIDATLSTLGLRSDVQWNVTRETAVALRGELGWQHQYGDLARGVGLKFNGSDTPFVVNSVSASRDGAVLKASAEVAINSNARLSLGYSGLLSGNYQDNSVNAGFSWNF
ncbi:MAG: AI-2E family transporter YdiK [Mixta calida]|nr:AI-2E family transporter YdiK [Mixta calida]